MPVSHVGLSVENIGPLSSFYASALQPLGYRYIGQREGQLGFGVTEADFFISPIPPSTARPAPVHVAFQAADTSDVRNFYACALKAGGRPAGPPSWRGQDVQIFNAAVHDLEGNTVEVVYHPKDQNAPQATSRHHSDDRHTQISHVTSPTRHAESPIHLTSPPPHSASSAPRSQTAKSHAVKSRSARSQASPSQASSDTSSSETTISHHNPQSNKSVSEDKPPSRKLVGTLIGAAASAAALCAMLGMERDSSRKERAFSDDMLMHKRHRRSSRRDDVSEAPSKQSVSRARTFYDVDDHTSTVQPRGTTYEAIEMAPPTPQSSHRPPSRRDSMFSAGSKGSKSGRPFDRASFRDPFLPDTVNQVTIRYRRRSSSVPPRDVSPPARSRPVDDPSQAARSTRSRPRTSSHAPSRQAQSRPPPSTRSSRTAKRDSYTSAAGVPIPASRTSRATARSTRPPSMLHPDTPCTAPLDVITNSFGGRTRSSRNRLFDVDTVVPDDSISCVSSNRPTRRWDGNGGSVRTVPQSRGSGRGGGGREYRERDREGKRRGRERGWRMD